MNMHKVARSFGKLHLHFSWITLGSNLQQAPSLRSGMKFNLVNLWANKPAGKCTPEKVQRCDVHKPTGNDRFYPQLISAELQVQLQSLLLSCIMWHLCPVPRPSKYIGLDSCYPTVLSIVSCHHEAATAATYSAMNSPLWNEDLLFLQNDQLIWLHTSSSVNRCLFLTEQSVLLPWHVTLGIFQGCPCAEVVLVHCIWPIR